MVYLRYHFNRSRDWTIKFSSTSISIELFLVSTNNGITCCNVFSISSNKYPANYTPPIWTKCLQTDSEKETSNFWLKLKQRKFPVELKIHLALQGWRGFSFQYSRYHNSTGSVFLENVNLSSSTSDRLQLFGRAKLRKPLLPSFISLTLKTVNCLYRLRHCFD